MRVTVSMMLLVVLPTPVCSRLHTEVGLTLQQMWSGHQLLSSPSGYGVFLWQDISPKVTLCLGYDYHSESQWYVGTMYRFLPPFQGAEVRDLFTGDARVQTFELIMIYTLADCGRMRLAGGSGLVYQHFGADIVGRESGFMLPGNRDGKLGVSVAVELEIRQLTGLPVSLRLGFRQRMTPPAPSVCTDCYQFFSDAISSSVLQVGLSVSLLRH